MPAWTRRTTGGGVRPNFNLFTKLSSYGVPVAINEMNGAEIYDAPFVNTSTSASMSACNSNLDAMLAKFSQHSFIEWIDLYELMDELDKTGPEGRFGLMFNLSTPKPLMSTIGHFVFLSITLIASATSMTATAHPASACSMPVASLAGLMGAALLHRSIGDTRPVGLDARGSERHAH